MEEEVGGGGGLLDSAQIASLRNGWRRTRCDGSRLWSGEEKEDKGGDTCYRAAINPHDGTLYPQTLHRRGHCRHHSGLLASPRPSSEHLSLPCTPSPPLDPAPLQLALIKIAYNSPPSAPRLPPILQAASTRGFKFSYTDVCSGERLPTIKP